MLTCARADASARVERCFPYTVCLSVSIIQGMPLLNVPAAWCICRIEILGYISSKLGMHA